MYDLDKFLLSDEDALVEQCWKSYVEHARGSLATDDEAAWRSTMQTWRRTSIRNNIHYKYHSTVSGEPGLKTQNMLSFFRVRL